MRDMPEWVAMHVTTLRLVKSYWERLCGSGTTCRESAEKIFQESYAEALNEAIRCLLSQHCGATEEELDEMYPRSFDIRDGRMRHRSGGILGIAFPENGGAGSTQPSPSGRGGNTDEGNAPVHT